MDTKSFWMDSVELPTFPALQADLHVDVLVVGGGITGITAAFLLKKAGRSVALIERHRLALHDTGHTTAHVTYVTDTRLSELVEKFGRDHAKAVWDAGCASIEQIESIVLQEDIRCEWTRVPGHLHTPLDSAPSTAEIASLREDADLAAHMGFDAAFTAAVPVLQKPGIRFANQGKLHPRKYLAALAQRIPGEGCHVFEETEATEFHDSPLGATANGRTITCNFIVLATHVPLQGNRNAISAALLQTKLALYSTYVIGARLPRNTTPQALWWDTADPYHYLRVDRRGEGEYAIFGGADHKTGQETDTEACFRQLEKKLRAVLPQAEVEHRWSGQVIETADGLPYIGAAGDGQFISTGYAGNGMTFGTLGAVMARDAVLGVRNPWCDLFSPERKTLSSAWDYLLENKDYPFYLVRDRLARAEAASLDELKAGEGKIVRIDGKKVAAHRDESGIVVKLSPVCTHMGCIVHWNDSQKTWDCPCHGSRFSPTGEVLGGPAEVPLAPA